MKNEIWLLRGDDTQNQRHGGIRQYRSFKLFINGVLIKSYRDDSATDNYASDRYLDDVINRDVAVYEEALRCRCIRGEFKGRVRLIPERRKAR